MVTAVSLTDTQIFTAVRAVLNTFGLAPAVGSAVPIVWGQVNRVPEVKEDDYLVVWPLMRTRLGMNIDNWGSPWAEISIVQSTEVMVQCDVHGPASADNAQRISTLWRDQFGVSAFVTLGLALAPLYTSDPKQMAFNNGEQQFEDRWVIDLAMQADIAVATPMQFADQLEATVTPVESLA